MARYRGKHMRPVISMERLTYWLGLIAAQSIALVLLALAWYWAP